MTSEKSVHYFARLRWGIAFLVLGYGLFSYDRESLSWGLGAFVLHALPLALQFIRHALLRIYALWFGVFLVAQALLTPLLKSDFVTLPPNMRITMDVQTRDIPGIAPGVRSITSDSRGFRAVPPVDYAHKKGLRIFAIGGSTTEGIYLDDRGTWPYLLQQELLNRGIAAGVINTGVSGLRAANHLATLKAITGLDADLAIFLVGANDWNRQIKNHFETPHETRLTLPLRHTLLGRLMQKLVIYPVRARLKGGYQEEKRMAVSDARGYVKEARSLERAVRHEFRPPAPSPEYLATLKEISGHCRRTGLRCLFVTQPSGYQGTADAAFRSGFWMTPPYAVYTLSMEDMTNIAALYNRSLTEFGRAEGLPVCDIAPHFPPSYDYFYDDMHFTESGARRVAELIAPCVAAALK